MYRLKPYKGQAVIITNWLEMVKKQYNGTLGKNILKIKVKTLYNQ